MDAELVEAAKETAKSILAGEYRCAKGSAYAAQALAFAIIKHDGELRRRAEARPYLHDGSVPGVPVFASSDAPYANLSDGELMALQEQALRWREQD